MKIKEKIYKVVYCGKHFYFDERAAPRPHSDADMARELKSNYRPIITRGFCRKSLYFPFYTSEIIKTREKVLVQTKRQWLNSHHSHKFAD